MARIYPTPIVVVVWVRLVGVRATLTGHIGPDVICSVDSLMEVENGL